MISRTRRRSGARPVDSRIKSMSSAFSDFGRSSSILNKFGEGVGDGEVGDGSDDDEVFSSSLLLNLVVTFRSPPAICHHLISRRLRLFGPSRRHSDGFGKDEVPEEQVLGASVVALFCFSEIAANEMFTFQGSQSTLNLARTQRQLASESRYRWKNTAVFPGVARKARPKKFCCWTEPSITHERIWNKDPRKNIWKGLNGCPG
jgi:hypothetical protein